MPKLTHQHNPLYSVCVCNYNMADTLERAMTSVVEQLDNRFEVLVVDDGSTDESIHILKKLAEKYEIFRFISLNRDKSRLLGKTRNFSIREAKGEYVLLHIDADDVWEPYLTDFVTLFHKLEQNINHDFYLSGQQTGIAKRSFLLSYGPYENIYRCEDRNLMMKLAKAKAVIFIDYKVYRTRLERPRKKWFIKIFRDAASHMLFDFRQEEGSNFKRVWYVFSSLFRKDLFSFKIKCYRVLIVFPVWIKSLFMEKISNEIPWQEFRDYHKNNRGTYSELMTRMGADPDISFLDHEAIKIYSYDKKLVGFRST